MEDDKLESKEAISEPGVNELKTKKASIIKRFLLWICGMDGIIKNRIKRQVKQNIDTTIDEEKVLSFICDL